MSPPTFWTNSSVLIIHLLRSRDWFHGSPREFPPDPLGVVFRDGQAQDHPSTERHLPRDTTSLDFLVEWTPLCKVSVPRPDESPFYVLRILYGQLWLFSTSRLLTWCGSDLPLRRCSTREYKLGPVWNRDTCRRPLLRNNNLQQDT